MARIVVIGGSGHVGTYLLPALVARGHEVVNVSRGTASPYREHNAVQDLRPHPGISNLIWQPTSPHGICWLGPIS